MVLFAVQHGGWCAGAKDLNGYKKYGKAGNCKDGKGGDLTNDVYQITNPIKPTKVPAKAPTQAPTKAPIKAPTKAPVKAPTRAPTKVPEKAPTKAPIKAPTKAPAGN